MDACSTPEPASSSQRASGSSFYTAMRILPRDQREAMFEIYSFCRRVDDVADSDGPRSERLAELGAWRHEIDALYEGRIGPRVAGLARPIREFDLAREDFLAVIDGMEMDTTADIRAPDSTTLDLYCDRVASAVGRLSVRVFGLDRETGTGLSHHLGRALQLTNILRDLDEDAAIGRLYVSREALQQAGIETTDPAAVMRHPALPRACSELVERARLHFAEANRIMRACPRRAVRAPRIMGEVYRTTLDLLVARGFALPRQPIHIPRPRLVWIVLRHAWF